MKYRYAEKLDFRRRHHFVDARCPHCYKKMKLYVAFLGSEIVYSCHSCMQEALADLTMKNGFIMADIYKSEEKHGIY